MGSLKDKTDYSEETKEEIRQAINKLGGSLNTSTTFRNYESGLEDVYEEMPKVSGEGSAINLSNVREGGLSIIPKGNCEQEVISAVAGTTVEGSNLTVNDFDTTKEMTITPEGNCEQDSYSGKNLIGVVNGTYQDEIIATVDNGTIILNGTTTQTNFISIVANTNYNSISVGDNFTVSINNPVANNNVSIRLNPNATYDVVCNTINKTQTFALQENRPLQLGLTVRVASGTTLTNFVLKPQVEKGSTSTTYEQYVGGIPSPNPSYPQPVKVVTGDNQVVVQNKNLRTLFIENAYMVYNNGEIRSNNQYDTYIAPVIYNENYIMSYKETSGSRGDISNLCFLDKNKNWLSGLAFSSGSLLVNINNQNCKYIAVAVKKTIEEFQIEPGSTATSYVAHQEQSTTLHLGSLELCKIGDYQDVITGTKDNWKVVRKVGKIVYDGSSDENWELNNTKQYCTQYLGNTISDAINETEYTQKSYTNYFKFQQGNPTDTTQEGYYWKFQKRLVIVIPNTLASTVADLRTWLSTHNVVFYYRLAEQTEETITDTTLVSQLNALADAYGYSGTTNIMTLSATNNAEMPVEVHYNYVTPAPSPDRPSEVKVVTGDNQVVVSNSDNTQSQTYTLHLGSLELCKLRSSGVDYIDKIIGTKNNWKLVKNIGKDIFDGVNIAFNGNGSTDSSTYRSVNRMDSKYKQLASNNAYGCMCDKLKNGTVAQTYGGRINTVAQGGNEHYIQACFDYSVGANYQEINTWLQNHNLEVYYILNTPTETPITDTTLINDLNDLHEAMGYDGQTNIVITSDSDNAQMIAEAKALKEIV